MKILDVTEVKSGPTSRKYKIVDKEDYESKYKFFFKV